MFVIASHHHAPLQILVNTQAQIDSPIFKYLVDSPIIDRVLDICKCIFRKLHQYSSLKSYRIISMDTISGQYIDIICIYYSVLVYKLQLNPSLTNIINLIYKKYGFIKEFK